MHQWISKVQTSSSGNVAVISGKVMIVRQTTNGPSLIIRTQTFVDFLLTDLFLLKLPLFIEEPLTLNIKKIAHKLKMDNAEDFTVFSKYVLLKSAWWESCSKKKCSQSNVSKEIRQLVTWIAHLFRTIIRYYKKKHTTKTWKWGICIQYMLQVKFDFRLIFI